MQEQILFSIIIPHYDIPKLLGRCLRSIPKRSDIQIIVIDDNSPNSDQYYNIVPELCNPNIEFYRTKEGKGGGYARNVGILKAKGKYLIFADADDYFSLEFNNILNDYRTKEFDIAYFKGASCDTKTFKETNRTDHLNKFIDEYFKGKDSNANNLRYLFGEPWCKIIKRELVLQNKIHYDETNIHNDTTFAYLIGYYAIKVYVDNRIMYTVTTREGSVSVKNSDDRLLTRVNVFGRAERFFKEHHIPIVVQVHYIQLIRLLFHCRFLITMYCINELRHIGFSTIHILINMLKALVFVLKGRFK